MNVPSGDKYSITIITSIYKRIDFRLATRVTQFGMKETRKWAGERAKGEQREDAVNVDRAKIARTLLY